MMKLFGEFLLSRNIVTEEQLLAALIVQAKEQPTLYEVALTEKIYDAKALVAIITEQTRSKTGFIEAAKAIQVWNTSNADRFEESLKKTRIPLGKILTEQGVISREQILNLLDEYRNDNNNPAADLPLNRSVVENYLEQFSDAKKVELKNQLIALSGWTQVKDPQQTQSLKALKDSIHFLQGISRLVHAKQTELLLSCIERCLGKMSQQTSEKVFDSGVFSKFSQIALLALDYIWVLRSDVSLSSREVGQAHTTENFVRDLSALAGNG